jgi:anti-anti-sigma factor
MVGAGENASAAPPPRTQEVSPLAAGEQSEPRAREAWSIPAAIVFLAGQLSPADVPIVAARVRACAEAARTDTVVCDVSGVTAPDCETVDALARVQLATRRIGARICLRNASPELTDLVALAGLARVLSAEAATRPGAREGRRAGRTSRCRGRT